MLTQSLYRSLEPSFDLLKLNSEQENPRIDRWSGPASVPSVSNRCNMDMCTETLGFENGAMCFNCELEIDAERKKRLTEKRSSSAALEFPPPLTTLRGEGRLFLRRKCEKGRVLLIGFRAWVVEAERSGGRLVLRIRAKADLNERGEEEEKEERKGAGTVEREEKGELMVSYGCGGKFRNVAAMFNSEALLLAT